MSTLSEVLLRLRQEIAVAVILILAILLLAGTAKANDGTEILARSAVVIDASENKILFGKNPHLRVPPASTTKLITAMVVLDKLNPDAIVTVSATAGATQSVPPKISAGDRFTVRDLLTLALMRSSNSATVALAEAVAGSEENFVSLMNAKAKQIGAENTQFANSSGLPGGTQYITAYDLALIMKKSLQYPLINEILNTKTQVVYSLKGKKLFLKNTNQLLWTEDDLIGGKTGYTKEARHCFVCASNKNGRLLISVLLGEPQRENLWEESKTLLARGYSVVKQEQQPTIHLTAVQPGAFVSKASHVSTYEGSSNIHQVKYSKNKKASADKAKQSKSKKSKKSKAKKPAKSNNRL